MNKHIERQYGYTLAEVLVALAIFAVIFLAALTAYDRSNRVFKTGVESSNLQQNTRVAFDKVVSDLRMAGFDFDRDGIPTGQSVGGTNVYQQPDEQFEYIAQGAVTVRANFDFESENQPCGGAITDNCDNGREKTLESSYFPVVTTGNDELVTYALVPDSQTSIPACDPSSNCVMFYADTSIPRRAYPDTGGQDEKVVRIPGVDLCMNGCNNPPYTLYRFTLDPTVQDYSDGVTGIIRTPLATNIRSMTLKYYQDSEGTVPLMDLTNTNDVSNGAGVLGNGQYQVSSPAALVPEREIRAKINSVRFSLLGMNETRDQAYTDTAETAGYNAILTTPPTAGTALSGSPSYMDQYRKYRLETLVSPRNIQKRGMREQDTFPPGPPHIMNVCTGACNGVYMTWAAPPVNATYGAPDQYKVIYDVATSTGYNCETTTFTNTYTYVFGTTPSCAIQPGVQYKFAVVALNSYGSMTSDNVVTVTPINATQPGPPVVTSATTTLDGKVTLSWNRPTQPSQGVYSCDPQQENAAELQGYIVERGLTPTGPWTPLPVTPTPLTQGNVTTSSPYDQVSWTDTTAVNCVPYYYRVMAVEACYWTPSTNNPATTAPCEVGSGTCGAYGISGPSNVVNGSATTTFAPAAPPDLTVDSINTVCVSGVCNVVLKWPMVNQDTASPPNPITIDTYIIQRQQISPAMGTWQNVGTATGGALTYTDPNVDTSLGQVYYYRVVAHSKCPIGSGTDSAPSPQRPFPCNFPPGTIGNPVIISSASFDGDGSASNPFKIPSGTSANAGINVVNPAPVSRVVGRDYNAGGTLLWQQTLNAPNGTVPNPLYSFTWALGTNTTEQFNVAIVSTGTGCVEQTFAYFEDEPQNCCLTPSTFDPTTISFSTGTQYVDFILKNICGTPLQVTGVDFTWSSANTSGGTKLDSVVFPTTSGGCSTGFGTPVIGTNCSAFSFGGSGLGAGPGSVPQASLPANILTVPPGCTNCVGAVSLTTGGINYNVAQPPTVTFTGGGGSGAKATAVVTAGVVTSLFITDPGSGYTSAPTITFTDPLGIGSGAAASATLNPPCFQCVSGVTMSTQGTGYSTPPAVTFTGGSGSGATGTATISGGKVTGVTITNRGSGYVSPPSVSFTGGGGSGATANSTIFAPYKIRVHFTKSLNNPVQPVTAFAVSYTAPNGETATDCAIK